MILTIGYQVFILLAKTILDKTNFVFMFSPNEKTEIVIQHEDNISLFELVMGEEGPTVNFIW